MSSPDPKEKKLEKLGRALRKADAARKMFVPPTRDEAILKQARAHFEAHSREERIRPTSIFFPNLIRHWRSLLGGTAIGCIVIGVLLFQGKNVAPRGGAAKFAREDVNRDGQVDILDAMTLAKLAEGKGAPDSFDQNGDRKIDEEDVTLIAAAAVRLN